MFNVNIFTAVIVLIMGIYDMSYAFNRRHQPNNKFGIAAFMILGIIFTIGGIVMIVRSLIK
ncbi:hypothetical protein [Lactobacillus kefiranofaciens]|uniref:Uncharacterized protein n=1 Tax=Lactobacillus kefiranofaciens TaxID=267818 RepID=A0AAX3UAG9_9LACO|nr:hypothetical protein [Lactobacillus kefiranofaciens]AEG39731.1 Hypothetical protein WANG_0036 [Lactobacillus kefiranofaciens subsp. kefiranofaciens]KRL30334.1 hypothetical protein FC94_GL001012 [Lactobacillus kefiranofaciens subsp. kefirgranum DSM 10550 = JCM 8572]KRM22902.1 hypothetical protein FC93_GL000839 [Lactobacillus kefiranofaciens subsp. kefiranofaciens DSM 5016 = JCM 6985]MCJ2171601.1 hypothetical protein [Lactobacillus kefiranofaciens]MCP9330402.1 hypothetical protein [Lactobacil